jgi:pimeloyl-ACP methyl ester carboxylesterase
MTVKSHLHLSDIRAASQLAIKATLGITDIVEAMHHNIARRPWMFGPISYRRSRGITGFVYKSLRGVTQAVGFGLNAATRFLPTATHEHRFSAEREFVVSTINGVLGDALAVQDNPLAIPMTFRIEGQVLELKREALQESVHEPKKKLLILVHGLCATDQHWTWKGHNHGESLAKDSGGEYSVVTLRYNSGLHISENGALFAAALEELSAAWPVDLDEILLLGHSLGGLVCRSAIHNAQEAERRWLSKVKKAVFLGSPHHGAPLERLGNGFERALGLSPYTFALARLGKIRSAGITDLRHGNIKDDDWEGQDRFVEPKDSRSPLPLPSSIECYTIAASLGKERGVLGVQIGDGIVPVRSALGLHDNPDYCLGFEESRIQVVYGAGHLDLLSDRRVYQTLKAWLIS